MIDFDPRTQEAIMTPDVAMKFLIWAAYFNGIEPEPSKSFGSYMKKGSGTPLFSQADAERLDRLKEALFKCFDAPSVARSVAQLKQAKVNGEQCPFPEDMLNMMFGKAN